MKKVIAFIIISTLTACFIGASAFDIKWGDQRTYSKLPGNTLREWVEEIGGLISGGDITGLTSIQWDLTTVDTPTEGLMYWNEDDGTLNIGQKGGTVNLQVGQEMLIRVKNGLGVQIDNGLPVYISGADGTNIVVGLADADLATGIGFRTIAVATEDILAGQQGYVTTSGFVRDFDTSSFSSEGAPLYLASGGGFTEMPPAAPDVTVLCAIMTRKSATVGEIYVAITSIPNLNSLSDVQGSVADNDILQWDAAANTWANTLTPAGLTSVGSAAYTVTGEYTLPIVDGSANGIIKTDGAGVLEFVTPTVDILIVLTEYDPEPARGSESNVHGAFVKIDDAASMSSGVPFVATAKGIGKVVIDVIAGTDAIGDITITGTSVDRDTGATTGSDTSVITLTGATTDGSTTDSNGNTIHAFTKAYISDKWFVGVVTLSTSDVDVSDMDIYHISFEQFNDQASITLNTFDVNLLTTSVNAEFDAYLFDIHVTGDECDIAVHAGLHIGANGETALVNKYWRLREGKINHALDGTTDGIWIDMHYSNSPAFVEDVTMKVWVTCSQPLTLQ